MFKIIQSIKRTWYFTLRKIRMNWEQKKRSIPREFKSHFLTSRNAEAISRGFLLSNLFASTTWKNNFREMKPRKLLWLKYRGSRRRWRLGYGQGCPGYCVINWTEWKLGYSKFNSHRLNIRRKSGITPSTDIVLLCNRIFMSMEYCSGRKFIDDLFCPWIY